MNCKIEKRNLTQAEDITLDYVVSKFVNGANCTIGGIANHLGLRYCIAYKVIKDLEKFRLVIIEPERIKPTFHALKLNG